MAANRIIKFLGLSACMLAGCGGGNQTRPATFCPIPTSSHQDCENCSPGRYPACGGYSPCLDGHFTRKAARDCAEAALEGFGEEVSENFQDGFIQAYEDLAQGASGVTPAVPPEKYWSAWYRSSAGHEYAKLWFAGYEAGVESARVRGLYSYNTVFTSFPGYPPSTARLTQMGHEEGMLTIAPEISPLPVDPAREAPPSLLPTPDYQGHSPVPPGWQQWQPPAPSAPAQSPLPEFVPPAESTPSRTPPMPLEGPMSPVPNPQLIPAPRPAPPSAPVPLPMQEPRELIAPPAPELQSLHPTLPWQGYPSAPNPRIMTSAPQPGSVPALMPPSLNAPMVPSDPGWGHSPGATATPQNSTGPSF